MQTVQSNLVPIELSFDNGATWQVLVCLTQYNIPVTTAINTLSTFCGTAVGVGTAAFNASGTAVCELNPTAGAQVTFNTLLAAQMAGLQFKFRVRYPITGSVGGSIFMKGDCYSTAIELQGQTNQALQFTWTLTGQGELDIVNP